MFAEPPPPPRRAPPFFGSFGVVCAFVFGAALVAVGGLTTAVVLLNDRPFWDDTILDERAVRAEGTALDVRSGHASVKRSGTGRVYQEVMEIQVRFADRRGRRHDVWVSTLDAAVVAKGRAHGALAIEYDPLDPSRARSVGERASVMGLVVLAPIGSGVVGVVPFVVGWLGLRRARRTYRLGNAARARVTAVQSSSRPPISASSVVSVVYDFESPRGRASGSWSLTGAPAVGTMVWVVYDPRDPRRNVPSAA